MTEPVSQQRSDLNDLYQRLIQISQEAFAGEYYNISYHALSAALHCVQELKDTQYLAEIESMAIEQLISIDTHHPEYEHSTQSAAQRHHVSIYKNLATQAKTRAHMIEREADWQEGRNFFHK